MANSIELDDRIEIRGLELLVFCGVLPEEQARRQPILFDLDIYVDLRRAGISDDLNDTVDYGGVIALISDRLSEERFELLERLAVYVADLVLEIGSVSGVTVTARKLRPPIPQHVATTGVRIHRTSVSPAS